MGGIPAKSDRVYSSSYCTKMDIAKALDRLCESNTFDRITIDALASEAGISRSSFYYHFTDKNDVVHWLSRMFYARGIDEIGRTLTWFEGHLLTTKSFREFRALFSKAAKEETYSAGQPYFIRHRRETLAETITLYKNMDMTPELSFQIEANAYTEMIMTNNYENGCYDLTIKEFCSFLEGLVPKKLYEALEIPVQRKAEKGDFYQAH